MKTSLQFVTAQLRWAVISSGSFSATIFPNPISRSPPGTVQPTWLLHFSCSTSLVYFGAFSLSRPLDRSLLSQRRNKTDLFHISRFQLVLAGAFAGWYWTFDKKKNLASNGAKIKDILGGQFINTHTRDIFKACPRLFIAPFASTLAQWLLGH